MCRQIDVVGGTVFDLPGEHPAGTENEADLPAGGLPKALSQRLLQSSDIRRGGQKIVVGARAGEEEK
jgi:hypothetical protein